MGVLHQGHSKSYTEFAKFGARAEQATEVGQQKGTILAMIFTDTGELWLRATRQVEATSVSEQGVANRQNYC